MKEYGAVEAQVETSASKDSLGRFALVIVFLATLVLIGGMVADKQRVAMAFMCGIGFFVVFGGFVILWLSGHLPAIIINAQNQKTMRLYHEQQFLLYQAHPMQIEVAEPQPLAELPMTKSFVPAVPRVEETLKLSAYDFVAGLYKDGAPDPERILPKEAKRPGQVQAKKPRAEVVEYLQALGMISVDEETRMLFFHTDRYSTLRECHQAIKHGVPGG